MKSRRGFTLIELPVVRKRGFTLIELLVVMFIIGLLAALVIVNVSSSRKTARDAKRMSDLRTIQGALEQYNNKNGNYPITLLHISAGNPWDIDSSVQASQYHQEDYSGAVYNVFNGSRSGYTGLCSQVSGVSYGGTLYSAFTKDSWIPNLVPEFLPTLPRDPKEIIPKGCYIYRGTNLEYMIAANDTMETICGGDPGDSCNPVSLQEMDKSWGGNALDIALFTADAKKYLWLTTW